MVRTAYDSPTPCIEVDSSLTVLSCNDTATRLFGWKPGHMIGRHLGECVFPDSMKDRLTSIYQRRLSAKRGFRLRHNTLLHGNEITECQWQATIDATTNRIYTVCVPPSDEFFAATLMKDTLSCFLWTFDTHTGVMENDPAWLGFLGYADVPDANRLSFWEGIVSPEDQATLNVKFRDFLDGNVEPLKIQYRLASRHGIEHRIETRAIVKTRDRLGNPRRVYGMHREIAEESESYTHDLANQLACIVGYANLISRSDVLPAALKNYVDEVLSAAAKAQGLLDGDENNRRLDDDLSEADGWSVDSENRSGDGHILIVDDEESVVGYFREIITQAGYRVTTSTNPEAAWAMFQAEPDQFDLVVTDQTMPTMRGDALTKAMLQIRPGLPVILSTGYSETLGRSTARTMGARAYIRKPVDVERLLDLINKSLRNQSLSE